MDRKELIESIEELQNSIGMWKVELGQLTDADFIVGFGFDEVKGQWKVFQNSEKGMQLVWYFDKEEEALLKLYKKINFQYKITQRDEKM